VHVETGGFRGDFPAWVQLEGLRAFAGELAALRDAGARPARATLSCDEPGIDLRIEAAEGGPIRAHFALESERAAGAWTTLSGTFELDPDGLPAIRASIGELLAALGA
jgi:hypothetical protein